MRIRRTGILQSPSMRKARRDSTRDLPVRSQQEGTKIDSSSRLPVASIKHAWGLRIPSPDHFVHAISGLSKNKKFVHLCHSLFLLTFIYPRIRRYHIEIYVYMHVRVHEHASCVRMNELYRASCGVNDFFYNVWK
jgi:hypothetical protein